MARGGDSIDLTCCLAILQYCAVRLPFLPLLNTPQLRIQGKELADCVSAMFHCSFVCAFQFIFSITLTANWI